MFIAHTISECQQAFNVCSPDAYGKPGRSLCQDVALHLDLSQFAAQLDELLALVGTERTGRHYASRFIGLAHPVHDAGGGAAKLLGQFAGLLARSNQFNHLLTKLRRIRWLGGVRFGHFGLLLQEQ